MARIDKHGKVHGTVGNYIYRVLPETDVVQSKPAKVKQTETTKESASEFGLASTTAKVIRNCLYGLIQQNYDGGMVNRFQLTVYAAIKTGTEIRGERTLYEGDLDLLKGFEFNNRSPLSEVLKVKPSAVLDENGRISVTLPPFDARRDLKAPSRTHGCHLRVLVTAFNFSKAYYQFVGHQQLSIDPTLHYEEQTLLFEEEIPDGCIVMVTLALHFFSHQLPVGEISLNSKELNPVSLIGVFRTAAQNSEEDDNRTAIPEIQRFPMTAYRGNDILKELKRRKNKKR